MAATLLMYYEECVSTAEIVSVTTKMQSDMVTLKFAHTPSEADETMKKWGKTIRAQFDWDNLHLTARQASQGGNTQIIACVQHMATMINQFQQHVETSTKAQNVRLAGIEKAVEGLS